MTTPAWNALNRHRVAAITAVKLEHCPAPAYKPAADVKSTMSCPKCKGRLTYTVSAESGMSTGRCSSAGCVNWSSQ